MGRLFIRAPKIDMPHYSKKTKIQMQLPSWFSIRKYDRVKKFEIKEWSDQLKLRWELLKLANSLSENERKHRTQKFLILKSFLTALEKQPLFDLDGYFKCKALDEHHRPAFKKFLKHRIGYEDSFNAYLRQMRAIEVLRLFETLPDFLLRSYLYERICSKKPKAAKSIVAFPDRYSKKMLFFSKEVFRENMQSSLLPDFVLQASYTSELQSSLREWASDKHFFPLLINLRLPVAALEEAFSVQLKKYKSSVHAKTKSATKIKDGETIYWQQSGLLPYTDIKLHEAIEGQPIKQLRGLFIKTMAGHFTGYDEDRFKSVRNQYDRLMNDDAITASRTASLLKGARSRRKRKS